MSYTQDQFIRRGGCERFAGVTDPVADPPLGPIDQWHLDLAATRMVLMRAREIGGELLSEPDEAEAIRQLRAWRRFLRREM